MVTFTLFNKQIPNTVPEEAVRIFIEFKTLPAAIKGRNEDSQALFIILTFYHFQLQSI